MTMPTAECVIRLRVCKDESCGYKAKTVERFQSIDEDASIRRVTRAVDKVIRELRPSLFANY